MWHEAQDNSLRNTALHRTHTRQNYSWMSDQLSFIPCLDCGREQGYQNTQESREMWATRALPWNDPLFYKFSVKSVITNHRSSWQTPSAAYKNLTSVCSCTRKVDFCFSFRSVWVRCWYQQNICLTAQLKASAAFEHMTTSRQQQRLSIRGRCNICTECDHHHGVRWFWMIQVIVDIFLCTFLMHNSKGSSSGVHIKMG